MIVEKLRTGRWFLQRPSFWPHAVALAGRKLRNSARHEKAAPEAERWADDRAVSARDALAGLGIFRSGMGRFPRLPRSVLGEGAQRAQQSLVKMGGPGDLELLYAAVRLSNAERVLETGVAYGWSSLAILEAMDQNGRGKLASVDMPYAKAGNEPYVGIVVPERLRNRWMLFREPDRNGIRKALRWLGGNLDLCHYDSDKSYAGRMYAYPILWDALRQGGLFISDDIQDNLAFRDFCARLGIQPQVTRSSGKFIGIARKVAGRAGGGG